ncbi:MAG: glycosyltransferase family 4 protein [Candidatus Aminicenantes bacterium]|nr:glycosyltransferase family 4 protein [Candidatus Aminicenantes bacterium]
MRIIVATSDVPFIEGGHLTIAQSTVRALNEYGHQAEMVLTPQNRFGRQVQAYIANRCYDLAEDGLGRKIQQVISLRFPSYAVKHPRHVCWLNHRMREYYDGWESLKSDLDATARIKESVRRAVVKAMDTYLLKHNVTKLYALSETVRNRLQRWGKIQSTVLYPPPPQRAYRTESHENFILAVSRLHKLKRMDLLIESFRYVRNVELKAVIIGEGPEETRLKEQIKDSNLEARIKLIGKSDEESLISHLARCRAVFFAPIREDYGFVTGEAFSSRKSVVTTEDSGGPAELVKQSQAGFILSPDPKQIAEKLDELSENKNMAMKKGQDGFEFISKLTWEDTVKKLVLA